MATNTLDVDAIIVAHDSGALLEEAVTSAEAQVPLGRVLVVDSGSTDGSVDALLSAHPDLHVIRTENRGFAAAGNVGIEATAGEFVLLLDPDATLEEGCVEPLVARAMANRVAGIVAPRITDPDGTLQEGSSGPFPSLKLALDERGKGLRRWLPGRKPVPKPENRATSTVDWVSAVCMLVRRRAISAVGPMDEGFFLDFGDVEWCHRMSDGGWMVLLEPDSTCVHARGGSGGGDSAEALAAYRAGLARYCKLYGLSGLALSTRIGLTAQRAAGGRG
jgi:N-acetylglucosaminyl-diphospho-decaprenol L-rhamnosyltransferase